MLLEGLCTRLGSLPSGPWPVEPDRAVVLPLDAPGQDRRAGVLVVGINPCRALDTEYETFLQLLAGHIGTAIANAHAYEAERRRAEALAEIDRAKTTFFSNVSHEFRTPLTLMLGPLEDALQCTSLPRSERYRLRVAHRNGLRLLKLVNTLLDFSRIEAGRVQAVYEPTDLAAYTADLTSNFRSACERAGLQLVVDCDALREAVYVDREMWEKIVLNLVSNAFKFTVRRQIVVALRSMDGHAKLEVRDTGPGIPREELPHIFQRFYRVHAAQSRTHEGTGIGLALVQELVKLHGGDITVDSKVNLGTAFTVTIPFGCEHLPQEPLSAPRNLASTSLGAMPFIQEALRWFPEEERLPATEFENDRPVLTMTTRGARDYWRTIMPTCVNMFARC